MAEQKNAFLLAGQKQTRHFVVPDVAVLCAGLSVQPRGSDPIRLEDVTSARRYRQALHKALVQRRPGIYAQAFLGARLGISSRSIRRYNRETGIHAQPTYQETPLFWTTVDQVPQVSDIQRFDIQVGGKFLLDETGKRWPLRREIAVRLLAQGRQVSLMRQGCSHYSVGEPLSLAAAALPAVQAVGTPAGPVFALAERVQSALIHPASTPVEVPKPFVNTPLCAQDSLNLAREGACKPRSAQKGVTERKRQFRRPLPDFPSERTACQLYRTIDAFSLPNARRLVDTYGSQPVEAALRKFTWLMARKKVARPVGLLVTLARMSWRASQRDDAPAPRFRAEPARKPRATGYMHPTRDPLWMSTAYRDWRAEFFGLDDPLVSTTVEEMAF